MALDENWRTSTRSGTNGDCVEVRLTDGQVEVRDSKDRAGSTQHYSAAAWLALLGEVKAGGFER